MYSIRQSSLTISVLISLFILSIRVTIYSQVNDLVFEHYSTDDELSAPIVRSIIQDKKGYLWFATYSGLDRYDGAGFKSYKHIPGDSSSITNGFLQCILEDKSGHLWIGTTNGLEEFNPTTETFKHYKPFRQITAFEWNKNNVHSIIEDKDGYIWLGTGDGLNKFDPLTGIFSHYRHNVSDKRSLRHNSVFALLEDKKGRIWIGTGNGLDRFDKKTESFIHCWNDSIEREGFYKDWIKNKNWITALYEDNNETLWVGTQGGLLELNSERSQFILYENDKNDSESISFYGVTSIYFENESSIWVGTWNGLNLLDKKSKKFSRYYHSDKVLTSLSNNSIASLLRERSGTLWVTTYGGGVNKVNRTVYPFKQYKEQSWKEVNRFSSASIMDIKESCDGSIWIATPIDLIKFYPLTGRMENQKIYKNVRIVYEDRKENLWLGYNTSSGRGLYKFDSSEKLINITDSAGNKFPYLVNGFVEYNDSLLWVCTEDIGAIVVVNTNTNKFSIKAKIFTTLNVIHLDKTGLLWIGTREAGLFCFDPLQNKIVEYFLSGKKNSEGLSGNTILTIHEDENEIMWLGTNMGLNKFDKKEKKFYHFTESNGLPHNWVYLIFEDFKDNLWVSTLKGISKFIPSENRFKNYDVLEGLVSPDRSGVGCQTANGDIYMVSLGGLTKLHPDSIKDNPYIPPIVITNFIVDNERVTVADCFELPFSSDHLTIEFAALSYIRPEKNQYAYKLEGLDDDWNYVGTKNYASYTNLDYGEYVFRVKGSNNDGIWNEAGISAKIIIHPPWWSTGWAFSAYGLILIFILYSIRTYDLKRHRLKHQLDLEHEHAEKLEELDRIKSRFFANISHEFRTPLTLIVGPAEQILSNHADETAQKNAGLIKNNANNMLTLIDQLLDLSKLDSGRLELKAAEQNIIPFLKGIVMSFESMATVNKIKLNLNMTEDKLMVYFDREKMETVIKNLLSNAFKFTPKEKEIAVSLLKENEDFITIKVSDTGIGISEEQLPKIFDRFYQVNSAHIRKHGGTGIGLSLTKELVELHHGSISVDSKKGEWTEFKIILPLGKEHLITKEIAEVDYQTPIEKLVIDKTEFIRPTNHNTNLENLITNKNIILIVEDNRDVREFIKDSLGKEYHFEEAENGQEGIIKAEEFIPDLIISDLMMPKMDGNEMTRRLKSDQKTSHIPIIMLTAKSGQENKIKGLETGADDFLTKPFDARELHIRIKNLINLRKKLQEIYSANTITSIAKSKHKLKGIDAQFMDRILKVIEEHISEEEFTIENFGNEVGMSRSQMFRKIKALTGKSCSVYLRSVRLAKAKAMLQNHEATVSEIAYSVGFGSPSYFAHCFKEEYGYVPSEIVG
jgi:signal transduction histidine kinase/ligand-binding sensor domain-containing protein/DNA-binding response OmpR family regulator